MSESRAGSGSGRGRRDDLLDVDLPEDDWLAQGGLDWGDPRRGGQTQATRSRRPRAPLWDEDSSEAWPGQDEYDDRRLSDPRWEIVRRRRLAVLAVAAIVAVVVIAVAIATAGGDGTPARPTVPVSTLPTSTTPATTPAATTPTTTTPTTTTPGTPTPATTPAPTDTTPATTPAPTTPDATTTVVTLPAAGKLKFGDTGDAVTALQEALAALDLDVGTPDGRFGAATRDAVIAFQTAQGLTPDGIVGPATVAKLDAAVAGQATDTGTSETDEGDTGSTTVTLPSTGRLAFGDTGDAVTALQNALATLELDVGTPDGRFGNATRDAVIAFQTAQGLTPDGIVGPSTVTKLAAAVDAAATGQALPVTIPTSVTLPAAGKLQPGDTGSEVTTLQQALATLDLDVGTPDGTYGPATKAAVAQFQTAQGLTPDGIVGPATVEKLNAALASRG